MASTDEIKVFHEEQAYGNESVVLSESEIDGNSDFMEVVTVTKVE